MIQFFHKRVNEIYYYKIDDYTGHKIILSAKGGTTYALEVPTLEEFNEFKTGSQLDLKIGISTCSNKENYNRKIGRNIALGRMKHVLFYITKYNENEIALVSINSSIPGLILKRSPKGNRVYFVGVN